MFFKSKIKLRTDGVYYSKTNVQSVYGEEVEMKQVLIFNEKGFVTWMDDVRHLTMNRNEIKSLTVEVKDYNETTSLVAKPKIVRNTIQLIFSESRERWNELKGEIIHDTLILDLYFYRMESHVMNRGGRKVLSNIEFQFIPY